jgi:hypothetical protein
VFTSALDGCTGVALGPVAETETTMPMRGGGAFELKQSRMGIEAEGGVELTTEEFRYSMRIIL